MPGGPGRAHGGGMELQLAPHPPATTATPATGATPGTRATGAPAGGTTRAARATGAPAGGTTRDGRAAATAGPTGSGSGPSAERDPLLDLLRTGAILVVVAWHWVFTLLTWHHGPHTDNPVGTVPGLWLLTWFMQVMPLFFLTAAALTSADRRRGREFLANRYRRLVPPVLPLVVPAVAVAVALDHFGRGDLARALVLAISPMWFLVVLAVLTALTPLTRRLHRAGPAAVLPWVAVAALADFARFTGGESLPLTLVSFVAVWGAVWQIGFLFPRLRRAGRPTRVAVAAVGLAGLAVGALVGPYDAAMVGANAVRNSNMGPPTLMVVALAVFQAGVVALAAGPLTRFARRARRRLDRVSEQAMTIFVWHLPCQGVAWAIMVLAGVPLAHRFGLQWWAQRPLWALLPGLLLALVLERSRRLGAQRPKAAARAAMATRS